MAYPERLSEHHERQSERRTHPCHAPPPAAPAQTTDDVFPGFRAEDMAPLHSMAQLLRRTEALNLAEAVTAVVLLASSMGHPDGFQTTERALYIVSCISNSLCLRCESALAFEC